jgi:hypothetical protein
MNTSASRPEKSGFLSCNAQDMCLGDACSNISSSIDFTESGFGFPCKQILGYYHDQALIALLPNLFEFIVCYLINYHLKKKVKLSLYQAMEAHRVVRR